MLAQIDAGLMPPPWPIRTVRLWTVNACIFQKMRQLLSDWIDGGKVLGNEEDLVTVPPVNTQLDNPDLTISMPAAYVPSLRTMRIREMNIVAST